MNEHEINVAYEEMLDRAWEEYNEQGPNEECNKWAIGEAMYEAQRDEECQYG